jgi:hypothetical protein
MKNVFKNNIKMVLKVNFIHFTFSNLHLQKQTDSLHIQFFFTKEMEKNIMKTANQPFLTN